MEEIAKSNRLVTSVWLSKVKRREINIAYITWKQAHGNTGNEDAKFVGKKRSIKGREKRKTIK